MQIASAAHTSGLPVTSFRQNHERGLRIVGTVQGGGQALSRSLVARLMPRHKSSEFFGLFGVFEKVAGIFGPLVFAGAVALFGSSRHAILSVIVFFVAGAAVLSQVDVDDGERVAREAERRATPAGAPAS